MTILVAILFFILLLVGALLIFAVMQPDQFRITRSADIDAAPDAVFATVSDFARWPEWSPWEKFDPGMKRIVSAPSSGVGATYAWEGNKKVGAGRQEILAVEPPRLVRSHLSFFRPWKAENTVEFLIEPNGGGSTVTWSMSGPQPLMARAMSLFFNMDKLVGADFERGLASLAEAASRPKLTH